MDFIPYTNNVLPRVVMFHFNAQSGEKASQKEKDGTDSSLYRIHSHPISSLPGTGTG